MQKKYKKKYRIKSARLQNWDYGWNAAYFVTICTKERKYFFGDISDRKMKFSKMGEIAQNYWQEIPAHFPFVELGEFIVMPNHVHGIVIINKPGVGAQNFTPLPPTSPDIPKNKFGPQSQNLASIIRGYKSGVKKYSTMNGIDFAWQPRFHDHIIRDGQSFQRISEYIKNNPSHWMKDEFLSK